MTGKGITIAVIHAMSLEEMNGDMTVAKKTEGRTVMIVKRIGMCQVETLGQRSLVMLAPVTLLPVNQHLTHNLPVRLKRRELIDTQGRIRLEMQ